MSNSKAVRFAAVALVIVLAACSPATPSAAPPSSGTPAASASGPAGSAVTTAPPAITPSPAPAGDGWTAVGAAQPQEIGAALTAVAGSPYAMDPAAGFRLRATGEAPVASLLARLRVEPALAYDVVPADGTAVVLRPSAPLAAGAVYRFTLLDPAGVPLAGWAFQVAGPPQIVGTIPRDEETEVPVTTGIEITFDRDGVQVGRGDVAVRLVPQGTVVDGRVEMHGRAAVFVPARALAASRVLEVTVRAGTGATDRNAGLPRAVTFRFQTARIAASGEVQAELERAFTTCLVGERALLAARAWRDTSEGGYQEVTSPQPVRVYGLAGETAAVRILRRLLDLPSWAGADARPRVATSGLRVVYSGSARFVRTGDGTFSIRLPFAARAGWYLVELRQGTRSYAILQASNVVGLAGVRADRVFAWANDARAGGPLQAAIVDILDGPRLGRTDAAGLLVASTPAGLGASPAPVLVRITARDGRRVVAHLSGAETLVSPPSWWNDRQPDFATWWTALSTDRWTYRPTDIVHAWGFLRARRDGHLPATVRLLLWRETDGPTAGSPIATVAGTMAPTGAYFATIPVRDLPHGSYLLELVADGRRVEMVSFQVGDLRKPAYRFEIAAAPRAIVVGDPITATVTARFFDGTPAVGIPVAISGGNDGEVRAATDTSGVAVGVVRPDPFDDQTRSQYECPSIDVRTDGAVEGDAEAGVTACVFRGTELVDAAAVRDGEALIVSGSVHAVDFAAVEAAVRVGSGWDAESRGAPIAGRRVDLQVTEQVLRRVVSSQWYDPITKQVAYFYDDEVVRSSTTTHSTTTRSDGTYRVRLAAPSKGRAWEVVAVVTDAGGHRLEETAYVGAPAARAASRYDLQIPAAGNGFRVGDTVTARIERTRDGRPAAMPVGGSNRYLFLVLGPTRFDAVVQRSATVSTRFRAADEPGLQVQAVWFTGRGYATLGGATAPLRTADRRITVALAANRARYEPGGTATVTIRTTDAAGLPIRATVLLRGVDEKLVAMGTAGFADPLELLYRGPDVNLAGGLAVSHPVWVPGGGDGKGSAGGGGGGGGERSDLADALSPRMVTTGADGRATAAFDLPDDITSWTIAATALTADRRAGSATVGLPVGLPFFVDATIAPQYLVGDSVAIRVRAFGSALVTGTAVRFSVSSSTLGMAPVTIDGTAFRETLVPLPALTEGAQRVTIAASSTAGSDRLVRTFVVVASRLTVGRRETAAIAGSVTPPGGPGLTTLVVTDAGRSRYLGLLTGLAAPRGIRADEQLAASVARTVLVDAYGFPADALQGGITFARGTYQTPEGGLAVLPYASADLELTVRALVADPQALLVDAVRPWLRTIADSPDTASERRLVALVGLAALGEPVLETLGVALDDPATDGRSRLWAAIGLALLGDRERAAGVERAAIARWGERRGDMVRLRIGDAAEDVSEATELLALLAAWVDDPLAADALAYVVANPPRDDLAVLAEVAVVARLVGHLAAEPAIVAVVEDGARRILEIPAGGAVTMEVLAAQRAAMRLEPVSGSAAVSASWNEPSPSRGELGADDPDLSLTRAMTPASPVPANGLVRVVLELAVRGPSRTGEVEVVDLLPSGLAPLDNPAAGEAQRGQYDLTPSRIEGQQVVFTVSFSAADSDPNDERPRVPGTFRLVYFARVVTAGTYAWQPAIARQTASPGLVAVTPAGIVDLR